MFGRFVLCYILNISKYESGYSVMISKKMENQLNTHMNHEFYSAYYYLSMSSWFAVKNLDGFANWYYVQAQEERDHAMLIYGYLLQVGAVPEFLPIKSPITDFVDTEDILNKTKTHEEFVTSLVYKLMDFAHEDKDYKTIQFLQWFVSEQAEEEENVAKLIDRLKITNSSEAGILFMDNEMATRVYTPTTMTNM